MIERGLVGRVRDSPSWSDLKGGRMTRLIKVVLAVTVLLSVAAPASAETIVTVTDPAGDVTYKGPGFLDIVEVEATRDGDAYLFRTDLVEPVPPDIGHVPPGNGQLWWVWGLDTDPDAAAHGYPETPGHAVPAEFLLLITWDGVSLSGSVVDRRPLLTGGDAIVTPAPFSVSENHVSMTVTADVLGNPASFRWGGSTFYRSTSADESSGWHNADRLDGWAVSP
jgi:hypothetical protein